MEHESVEAKTSKSRDQQKPSPEQEEQSPAATPVHQLLRLQRSIGNRNVQRLVGARLEFGSIQRQTPPPAADTDKKGSWQVPDLFGGGVIDNPADASAKLIDIKRELEPLKDQFEGIPLVFSAIEKLLPETYGKDPALTPELASKLNAIGVMCVGAYNVALDQAKAKIKEELTYKDEQSAEIEEKAAEILHETAFGKEADNEALEHAKEGFEKVHIFIEWAHYANEWVVKGLQYAQSAKKFEHLVHSLEGAGELAEKASIAIAALNSALAIYSAIKVSGDPGKSGTQKTVSQMKAGYSAVPVITAAAGTVAGLTATATGVGLLWTTLVPQIDQALHMIEQVDERIAAFYKATSADEWWEEARKEGGGTAPQIPANVLSHFPGGQETLNFMWAIFKGSPPDTVPAAVQKFFYDARKKMNVGHEDDQLETEWHLFSANEVKNLVPWVQAHKGEVWGMLYGSMPHP